MTAEPVPTPHRLPSCCENCKKQVPRLWGFFELEGGGGELVGGEKEFPSSCLPCSALVQRAARL